MEESGDAVDLDTSSENSQQQWASFASVTSISLNKTPIKGILLQSSRYVSSLLMILVWYQTTFLKNTIKLLIKDNLKLTTATFVC